MDPRSRLLAIFASQWGLITRRQAVRAGLTLYEIRRELAAGRWVKIHPGVYRLAGTEHTSETTLLAACLACEGWASHEWAAWLWEMANKPTSPPSITVHRRSQGRPPGITVHSCTHPRYARPPRYRNIPCTDRLDTMFDFAAVASSMEVDRAIDTGLNRGYFSLATLLGEFDRGSKRYRRRGAGAIRVSLEQRSYIGAPVPSVLESMVLRLLGRGGIRPLWAEHPVWVADHCYRLDFALAEDLALEVDGYLYHPALGASRDNCRRNELVAVGWSVLVYKWRDIKFDGDRVLAEVRAALSTRTARQV